MKHTQPILTTAAVLIGGISICNAMATESSPDLTSMQEITGEQLIHQAPENWKPAWFESDRSGSYLVEYIPKAEQIQSWTGGYLQIQRIPYPNAQLRKQYTDEQLVGGLLVGAMKKAEQTCSGKHEQMSLRTNQFNGVWFAVSGGFCDKYGPTAPNGEGAFMALVAGHDFLFKIQYGWRPDDDEAANPVSEWRITPELAKRHLEAIKASLLCGAKDEPACPQPTSAADDQPDHRNKPTNGKPGKQP